MVRVCPYCSNVDVEKLKELVGEDNVVKGCIGQCRAYSKESVGKVNGKLIIKETQEEFFEECKKEN